MFTWGPALKQVPVSTEEHKPRARACGTLAGLLKRCFGIAQIPGAP